MIVWIDKAVGNMIISLKSVQYLIFKFTYALQNCSRREIVHSYCSTERIIPIIFLAAIWTPKLWSRALRQSLLWSDKLPFFTAFALAACWMESFCRHLDVIQKVSILTSEASNFRIMTVSKLKTFEIGKKLNYRRQTHTLIFINKLRPDLVRS